MRFMFGLLVIAIGCAVFGGVVALLVWALNGQRKRPALIAGGVLALIPFVFLGTVAGFVAASA